MWRRRLALAALSFAAALALPFTAGSAWAMRVALVVGNDAGDLREERLRYAETDAARMAALFARVAGFAAGDTQLLAGRSAADVRQAFSALSAKLAATPGEHLFVFYYSGHADSQALHLGTDTLSFAELKSLSMALPAAARVLVVDACQSGALARLKGGRRGAAFELEGEESPRGLAILASARDSEFAQESDELRGSFFTHHLHAGLSGRADANRDGRVSVSEAFQYASQETLSGTARTWAGPQHPTFRYDLVGQSEVVLSFPGQVSPQSGYGRLRLDRTGWFFVRRWPGNLDGNLIAEVRNEPGQSLAVEAGRYLIEQRHDDELRVARVDVIAGQEVSVDALPMERVRFGRAVRKGAVRRHAFTTSVDGVARTPIASLGPGLGVAPGARFDGPRASLEARLGLVRSFRETFVAASTWDLSLSLSGMRLWDFRRATIGAGVELGGGVFRQQREDVPASTTPFMTLGPRLLVELPLGERLCLRAEAAFAGTVVRVEEGGDRAWSLQPAVRVGLGVGAYL